MLTEEALISVPMNTAAKYAVHTFSAQNVSIKTHTEMYSSVNIRLRPLARLSKIRGYSATR